MKFLLVCKQKKNVETFLRTIHNLLARGHAVTLAVQERKADAYVAEATADFDPSRFRVARCPAQRSDAWADVAPLLRSLADCVQYQQPSLRGAQKLQARTVHKLREELRLPVSDDQMTAVLRDVPPRQLESLRAVLDLAERALPPDPLLVEFLRAEQPDVLLLTPLVHFGSAQADLVAAARALALPVGMLLFSWDNLSTKGRIHRQPDWMFVWNERQRREAAALHGFPESRVVVVGAPRFDGFFTLRHRIGRESFHRQLGLDPSRQTLLYVCSSAFVSAGERPFVERWLHAIRTAPDDALRSCNVIVRPHPDIGLLGADQQYDTVRWPDVDGLRGQMARPFGDSRAVVLWTSDRASQGLYECLGHSAAVVGLNTSAELESAIAGRPVYTILADEADADGQQGTLHFHYLLESHEGFVREAKGLDEHVSQLAAELASPTDAARLTRFVDGFLRPLGDQPVSDVLAGALERTFAAPGPHANVRVAGDLEAGIRERDLPGDVGAGHEAPPAEDAVLVVPADAGDVVQLAFRRDGPAIRVRVAAGSDEDAYRLDRAVLRWIFDRVAIGGVLYDVGAGPGLYTTFAAKHRGAVVVAFEPGYAAYHALCDTVLRNGCDGAVMPVPLAVADFDGLGGLRFPPGLAGQHRHSLRREGWAVRRPAGDERPLVQSTCVTSLDRVVRQFELPAPTHLRLAESAGALEVLHGAAGVLASPVLRSILLTVPTAAVDAVARVLGAGWGEVFRKDLRRDRAHVAFERRETAGSRQ